MAVAKKHGREKPTKIEQRKVRGPRTGARSSGRSALLAEPNLHRAGPGGRKHIKGGAKRALSPCHVRTLFVSLSHPPLPTARRHAPPLSSLLRGRILLLPSK